MLTPIWLILYVKKKQQTQDKEWEKYEHQLAEIMEYVYAVTPDFGLTIYQATPVQ